MPPKQPNTSIRLGYVVIEQLRKGKGELSKKKLKNSLGIKKDDQLLRALRVYNDMFDVGCGGIKTDIIKPNLELFANANDPKIYFLQEMHTQVSLLEKQSGIGSSVDRKG